MENKVYIIRSYSDKEVELTLKDIIEKMLYLETFNEKINIVSYGLCADLNTALEFLIPNYTRASVINLRYDILHALQAIAADKSTYRIGRSFWFTPTDFTSRIE